MRRPSNRAWVALAAALALGVAAIVAIAVVTGGSGNPAGGGPSQRGSSVNPDRIVDALPLGPTTFPLPSTAEQYPLLTGPANVIDSNPQAPIFPGGLIRLGDGTSIAAFQRRLTPSGQVSNVPTGTVVAREGTALLKPFGPPTQLSAPDGPPGFDPDVVELPDGKALVAWQSQVGDRSGQMYAMRLGPNRYTPATVLFTDPGGGADESTVARLYGRAYIVYAYHPDSRQSFLWDFRIREIDSGPKVGPPVTVASNVGGPGSQGVQRRATAAETGVAGGIIVVWPQHATPVCEVDPQHPGGPPMGGCGPRPVYAAISADYGTTWGKPFEIATFPGHDLIDPIAIEVAPDDLRVYFTVDRHLPEAAYVESTDHGRTWSQRHDVWFPPQVSPVHWGVVKDPKDGLVAYVNTRGLRNLITFVLER